MNKISLPLKALQTALATVSPAVQRNTTIPILGNVRIEPQADAVELTTTNLELSIQARVAVAGMKAGDAFLLPAAKLESYAKLLEGDAVSLALDGSRATLRCGRSNTKLPVLPTNNFPAVGEGTLREVLTLPESQLRRALDFVAFAISAEESRYTLAGAQIESEGKTLRFVATDGHRLALFTIPCEASEGVSMLAPRAYLQALAKVLDRDGDTPVRIGDAAELVGAIVSDKETSSVKVMSRKLAGRFPNWKAVVPKASDRQLTVDAAEMAAALRRAMSFADAGSGAVKLTIADNELRMFAVNADTGESNEAVDVAGADGMPTFSIGFKGSYLLDALSRLEGGVTVDFGEKPGAGPVRITAEIEGAERFEYVVMPLRV